MIEHLLIHEDGVAQPFDLRNLPAAVGSGPHAAIQVPIQGRQVIAGYLNLNPAGQLTFEPSGVIPVIHGRCTRQATDTAPAQHEHQHLLSETLLGGGDILRIGDHCQVNLQGWGNEMHLSGQLARKQTFADADNRPTAPRKRRRPAWVGLVMLLLLLLLAALAGVAWLLLTSKRIAITSTPNTALHLDGGWFKPKFKDGYLVRTGEYTVRGKLDGHHPIAETIIVTNSARQDFTFDFRKLPGRLSAYRDPSLEIPVHINGAQVGTLPLRDHILEPGDYEIAVFPERYFGTATNLTIEGMDIHQTVRLPLTPKWSDITIAGPEGAELLINGESKGFLPKTLELFEGDYELTYKLPRFLDFSTNITVRANTPVVVPTVRMQPAPATIKVTSDPPGAEVTRGTTYAGNTPVEFNVEPNQTHTLHLAKLGYTSQSTRVLVGPTERKTVHLTLAARTGMVHFNVTPPDVQVFVEGQPKGPARPMVLPAIPQTIEVRREGYAPFSKRITPRPGIPALYVANLKPLAGATPPGGAPGTGRPGTSTRPGTPGASGTGRPAPANPEILRLANGPVLKTIRPEPFTLGASRREQGRRSNETQRPVVLRRPFYLGLHEVTNKQFQQFDAAHRSGSWSGETLAGDSRPAVNLTWNQAVEYCNWLSKAESRPAAYQKRGTTYTLVQPPNTGYRLPTEAEWEFAARYRAPRDISAKYVWGGTFPPVGKAGNFADAAASDLIANALRTYRDGHRVSSPVGTFPANPLGLHDLGGNVAEWCHDGYDVVPASNPPPVDPLGVENEMLHVIRGASWKDGSISALRTSYRNYGETPKPYVGFRVARYVQ